MISSLLCVLAAMQKQVSRGMDHRKFPTKMAGLSSSQTSPESEIPLAADGLAFSLYPMISIVMPVADTTGGYYHRPCTTITSTT